MEETIIRWPELNGEAETGKWYRISPEGALCADGSPWHGNLYKGEDARLIIYFCGGGVSVDAYTAERPEQFYFPAADRDGFELIGMPAAIDGNPFKDWSKLVIPYATGDFHVGMADYHYTKTDGTPSVVHHHGYTNCMTFLREGLKQLAEPDTVVLAGFSAGGMGVFMLADEIIDEFFPTVENVTVVVDSPLIPFQGWRQTAETVWGSPDHISKRISTDNLSLDHLKLLADKRPNVKLLLTCSVRDIDLIRYTAYLNTGSMDAGKPQGDAFQLRLKGMVEEILAGNNTAVLIWDELKADQINQLTQHTIIFMPTFLMPVQGTTAAKWIMDAVDGTLNSYGLQLLDSQIPFEVAQRRVTVPASDRS